VKAIKRPAHYTPVTGDHAALARKGKALFNDESLSLNETSCAACHDGHAMFKKSFSNPYPHHVNMAKAKFDIDPIHLDEMVQLCMIVPMASKPFAWDSQELAAMVAYLQDVQRDFIKAQK
jgi:cytochrome c